MQHLFPELFKVFKIYFLTAVLTYHLPICYFYTYVCNDVLGWEGKKVNTEKYIYNF